MVMEQGCSFSVFIKESEDQYDQDGRPANGRESGIEIIVGNTVD